MTTITTLKAATTIAGSIGYLSKMPGTSYGISAYACHVGSKLVNVPGSTCSGCYAMRGNYIYTSVQKAQATRLAGTTHPQWVEAMIYLLERAHNNPKHPLPAYHRWHDSGDLQDREHLAKICAVARATPWLRHWLPTREAKLVRDYLRDGGTIPDNLLVRLSATMIDGPTPKALPHTSTVHHASVPKGHVCPARKQGNKCEACRACWSFDVPNVSYHKH